MESWKVNLISVWFGCFFTGLAISQILPFLPLYVSQLGVTSHEALSMWSGLTFSVTFLVSAIVSPMWGSLADRKGRKLMLLRASLGMAIAILLQAFATNVWQPCRFARRIYHHRDFADRKFPGHAVFD